MTLLLLSGLRVVKDFCLKQHYDESISEFTQVAHNHIIDIIVHFKTNHGNDLTKYIIYCTEFTLRDDFLFLVFLSSKA